MTAVPEAWRARLAQALSQHAVPRASDYRVSGLPRAESAALAELVPAELRRAAVLVGLVERDAGPTLLLTVRSGGLSRHAGHVSFPGGRIEAQDADAAAAAVREAHEEIGLAPADATVLGYLPDHVLIESRFVVTPVVASIRPPPTWFAGDGEVAEVFELPLAQALDRTQWRARRRRFAAHEFEVFDITAGAHPVVGATAGIVVTLARLLEQGADR